MLSSLFGVEHQVKIFPPLVGHRAIFLQVGKLRVKINRAKRLILIRNSLNVSISIKKVRQCGWKTIRDLTIKKRYLIIEIGNVCDGAVCSEYKRKDK